MTLPPPNATTDEILDQLLDAEGLLRERLGLALTMLRRFTRGWTVYDCGVDGPWWQPDLGGVALAELPPTMALTPDESRLWEALRKGSPDD